MTQAFITSRTAWNGCVIVALATLCAAPRPAAADSLEALLDQASRRASAFVDVISTMDCTEHVLQVQLGSSGKAAARAEATFDYLVMLISAGGELNLVESRLAVAPHTPPRKEQTPLLLSNGLSLLFLIFHPYYASGFDFGIGAEETLGERTFATVHFRHIRGTRSPAALAVRGREYQLDLSGTAWIDRETGTIAKIAAGLDAGMEDIGLRAFQSEVLYAPVAFKAPTQTHWLPVQVTVEVESRHQHWRNVHQFSNYRRFSVTSQEEVNRP